MGSKPSKASAPSSASPPPQPEANSCSSLPPPPSEANSCSSLPPPPSEANSCSSLLPPPSEADSCSSLLPPPEADFCLSLWSDLPPELAGLVLSRFRSLADRVRFGSVCRHWCHAARQQAPVLPPVLPWTINFYTGEVQTISDGEVHRLLSGKLALFWSSAENWLLMLGSPSSGSRNFLENPLSGATLPLPGPGNLLYHADGLYCLEKFIVCPDNLVVATARSSIPPNHDPLIVCCRPGTSSWTTSSQSAAGYLSCYEDIAFHDRNIYAITERGDLFAHEVSDGNGAGMKPTILLSSEKLVIKGDEPWCYGMSSIPDGFM